MRYIGDELAAHLLQPADLRNFLQQEQHAPVGTVLHHRHPVHPYDPLRRRIDTALFMNRLVAQHAFIDQLGQLVVMLKLFVGVAGHFTIFDIQHPFRGPVQQGEFALRINHDNAAGHIVQYALQQILVITDGLKLGLQAVRHRVNGFSQLSDLILPLNRHSGVIVQVSDAPGDSRNLLER
ncbi:hypothetical protein D3C73_1159720 [compost metagenome]